MASKKLALGVAAAALAVVGGCYSFEPLSSGGGGFVNAPGTDVRCLDQSADTILKYWEGALDGTPGGSAGLDGFWGCNAKAVNVFRTRVRGAVLGQYTPEELRTLISKFFIKDAVISDRLLEQAMKVKTAFLGGTPDLVSADEIGKVLDWIDVLKEQSIRVYPYMGHFLGKTRLTEASVEEAYGVVLELATRLGEEVARSGVSLEFETIRILLDELTRFVASADLGNNIGGLRDRVRILRSIKMDLIGGDGTKIDGPEWVIIFRKVAQMVHYYLQNKLIEQGP